MFSPTLRPVRGTPKETSLNIRGAYKARLQHLIPQLDAGPRQTFVRASYIRAEHGEGVIVKAFGALSI